MITLQELFKDHQLNHSQLQQDYFITAKSGGTTYGMYKQALRELHKRYRGLKQLYAEKKLLQVDIDELMEKESDNKFEERRNEIKFTQKIMSMEEMDKNISETEREFKRFYQQAVTLKQQIGELTDEKRHKLDTDMWEHHFKEQIAIDFICNGRLKPGTVENIMCLPIKQRKKLLYFIRPENQEELISWYETKQSKPLKLSKKDINVKQLME